MKYGLTAQSSLNMTVNPDFGQVEADPSVLNLTAFETQYEERRPFFIEGGSFLKSDISYFILGELVKRLVFYYLMMPP